METALELSSSHAASLNATTQPVMWTCRGCGYVDGSVESRSLELKLSDNPQRRTLHEAPTFCSLRSLAPLFDLLGERWERKTRQHGTCQVFARVHLAVRSVTQAKPPKPPNVGHGVRVAGARHQRMSPSSRMPLACACINQTILFKTMSN